MMMVAYPAGKKKQQDKLQKATISKELCCREKANNIKFQKLQDRYAKLFPGALAPTNSAVQRHVADIAKAGFSPTTFAIQVTA